MARKSLADTGTRVARLPSARLAPPADLSEREAEIWRAVVETKPAEWFAPDSAPLLKEYVRAVVTCDRLAGTVEQAFKSGVPSKSLLDMRDKESRRSASLATKLRLTQQSRYRPDRAATADKQANGARPWERAS